MNIFEKGHNFLTEKLHNSGKSNIEIISGTIRKTVKAQLVRTIYENTDSFGTVMKMESRDFIVRVQDITRMPMNGDIIRFGNDNYKVLSLHGQDCYTYANAFKTSIRIHTKKD